MLVERLPADEPVEFVLKPRELDGHKEQLYQQQEYDPDENEVGRRLETDQFREEKRYLREYAYNEQKYAEENSWIIIW